METIKSIMLSGRCQDQYPTCDFWQVTTDHDASMGNPALTLAVSMDSTAENIANEYASQFLYCNYYDAEDESEFLAGRPVTIHLTAPDGTETEHPATFR